MEGLKSTVNWNASARVSVLIKVSRADKPYWTKDANCASMKYSEGVTAPTWGKLRSKFEAEEFIACRANQENRGITIWKQRRKVHILNR